MSKAKCGLYRALMLSIFLLAAPGWKNDIALAKEQVTRAPVGVPSVDGQRPPKEP